MIGETAGMLGGGTLKQEDIPCRRSPPPTKTGTQHQNPPTSKEERSERRSWLLETTQVAEIRRALIFFLQSVYLFVVWLHQVLVATLDIFVVSCGIFLCSTDSSCGTWA